jgi:hypothetical protein
VSSLPPLSISRTSLRLVGIWAASLIVTVVALVGGAVLAPFLPEEDIVHCTKCLVILGILPFGFAFILAFLVLQRSRIVGSDRARRATLVGYSVSFAVAATFVNLIVIGSLMLWAFPT